MKRICTMIRRLHGEHCFTVLLLVCIGSGHAEDPEITDRTFIDECVTQHNKHRSSVVPKASNMRYMSWDNALAVTARAWARRCEFVHNIYLEDAKRVHPNFTSVGENLWAGAPPSTFTVEGALSSWVTNEVKFYSYSQNSCDRGRVCGHYTQAVWADSYKVGCAAQTCPGGVAETTFSSRAGVIFVCNYATAGNYAGAHPYKGGASCSACTNEACEANLCRNDERDKLRDYNWTPDWDPALSSCGTLCQAVLGIRPVALGLTFLSVYGLQRRYPEIFAYE